MTTIIKDGTGSGYNARVDFEHNLRTKAVMVPHSSHHSLDHQNTFSSYNKHTIQTQDTEEIVSYITYTGSKQLVVSSILFASNSVTAGITKFELFIGSSVVSDGLSGGVDPDKSNWNSGNPSEFPLNTSKHTNSGASAITASTAGTEIFCLYMKPEQGYFMFDTKDSIVLEKSGTLYIVSESPNAGDKIRSTIIMFEEGQ